MDDTIGSDVDMDEEEIPEDDEEKGSKPEFIRPLETQIVRAGEKALFECEVIGEPKPSVIWQKNGRPIRDCDEYRYVVQDNVYKLAIKEAFPEDAAVYSVLARNTAGKATSDADLIVKQDKVDRDAKNEVPTFITPLKNQTVNAGDTLTLRVRASGYPTPTLKWFRSEQEISITERNISILDDGHGGSVLTIRRVELKDAHLYRCVAANAAGEASTEGTVTVEGKHLQTTFIQHVSMAKL